VNPVPAFVEMRTWLARQDVLRYRTPTQMIAAIISNPFARLSFRAALDILIIAMLIYYVLKLLRGTRAMQMLMNYEWPGNVRELENVIQGSIIRTDTDAIDACDLPEYFQESESHEDEPACVGNGTFDRLLRDYKFKLATRALQDCGGNKTLASRSLDISRAYLHRLLKLNDREEYAVESDLSETA